MGIDRNNTKNNRTTSDLMDKTITVRTDTLSVCSDSNYFDLIHINTHNRMEINL